MQLLHFYQKRMFRKESLDFGQIDTVSIHDGTGKYMKFSVKGRRCRDF